MLCIKKVLANWRRPVFAFPGKREECFQKYNASYILFELATCVAYKFWPTVPLHMIYMMALSRNIFLEIKFHAY